MSTLTGIEIFNLHSKHEVDIMLSQSVREIFAEQDKKLAEQRREVDLKLVEQRREFDERMKEQRSESLAARRWMVGTIITVGLSLAAYLSALIHFNH